MSQLTTIFTGHTLRLTDIRAVSGIMIETKPGQPFFFQTMYLEITLADTTTPIRYVEKTFERVVYQETTEEQKKDYSFHLEELKERRAELIEEWEIALHGHAEAATVSE